jgi:hypothetical protein
MTASKKWYLYLKTVAQKKCAGIHYLDRLYSSLNVTMNVTMNDTMNDTYSHESAMVN